MKHGITQLSSTPAFTDGSSNPTNAQIGTGAAAGHEIGRRIQ